jgi:hypothetical protein
MDERVVAVLIGTVQLQLAVKVVVPPDDDGAAPRVIEKIALETIGDNGYGNWTLLDDLGVGITFPLHRDDFVEVRLQRVETLVSDNQQPKVLWEREE